jgi:hypothetical protein
MNPCPDRIESHVWSHCRSPRSKGRGPCHGHAMDGTEGAERCRMHVGPPKARAMANIRAELAKWTLGEPVDDPADVLLRLITQSRMRAEFYATLLQQAYDSAERIAAAAPSDRGLTDDLRRDFDNVLQAGGVAALIGKTYGAAGKEGDVYATGEAIRGLAKLEADERDRCANFCRLAIAAGIAERLVKVAEQLAATIMRVLVGALDDAGVTGDQRQAVVANAGRRLASVGSAR